MKLHYVYVWQPWKWAELIGKKAGDDLFVEEPPCKHCALWSPTKTEDGVILCHSVEQYRDFSCFSSVEKEVCQ